MGTGKLDPNVIALCVMVVIVFGIIFGSLTMNARWNLEAKCRAAAEDAVAKAMTNAPR